MIRKARSSAAILVVAAAIEHDGRILAARLPRGDGPSRWEFPGGKVEPGERPEQALRREIREELAMEIEVAERVAETTVHGAAELFHLQLYAARWLGCGPKLTDHDRVGWFTSEELRALDWHTADLDLLDALLRCEDPRS